MGNFQPGRKELAHLGKMKKKRKKPKGGSEKIEPKALEKEKTKVSLLGSPRTRKSARGF